ncbi:hypothetical protein HBN50_05395 [Halobacteriovorax sp. GB3]|uniref:hypothetical protein n=1 Tax=Halobacteriovorax sp. GB3 TaxID=2719615 RepID=UPI0023623211|nr:hypothetical protein [Halobacteriovorax sp. GB3]MDD0852521.1 hypothetical protein [Halobacteriovorax sp. GB3]
MTALSRYKNIIFLFIFSLIFVIFLVGDFDIRFATIAGDDSFLAYSNYLKDSARFINDYEIQNNILPANASALNYLSTLIVLKFGISALAIAKVVIFLQSFLFFLATFLISKEIFKNDLTAYLAVFFSALANPTNQNLADYGGLEWMPYAGLFALPFIGFSLLFLLRERRNLALLFVIIGGFFHPSMGVYGIGIYGIYLLLTFTSVKSFLRDCCALVAGLALFISWPLINASKGSEIAGSILKELVRSNGHINPGMSRIIPVILFLLGALILAFSYFYKKEVHKRFQNVYLSTGIACCVFILIHILSVKFGVIPGMRLIGTRSTQLLSFISIPILILGIIRLSDEDLVAQFIGLLILLNASEFGSLVYSVGIFGLALYFLPISQEKMPKLKIGQRLVSLFIMSVSFVKCFAYAIPDKKLQVVLLGLLFALILYSQFKSKYVKQVLIGCSFSVFSLFLYSYSKGIEVIDFNSYLPLATLFLLSLFLFLFRKYKIVGLLPLFILFGLGRKYISGSNYIENKSKDFYQMQVWVNQNTDENEGFYIKDHPSYYGWRVIANRPVIKFKVGNPYFYTLKSYSYEESIKQITNGRKILELNNYELERIKMKFGLNYIVISSEINNLKYPVVYKNDSYKIIRI